MINKGPGNKKKRSIEEQERELRERRSAGQRTHEEPHQAGEPPVTNAPSDDPRKTDTGVERSDDPNPL